jgi:hypothetical protein
MIDLTSRVDISKPLRIRTIMTCDVWLDKQIILEALICEQIFIDGKYYEVPEIVLLESLRTKQFGMTRLEFERLEFEEITEIKQ